MSRSNTRSRRANWTGQVAEDAKNANPSPCSRCQAPKLSHTACPTCGYYNGRQVIDVS
ncbi:MAG: 50S ribosomal protein L32 [Mycobacteriales bacterium]